MPLVHYNDHTSLNLGPLVLVAVLYEAIGIVIAWIIKQVYWTPHRFRYGILVAGGWGNYGDIRASTHTTLNKHCYLLSASATSVLMSITGAAPFNGTSDQTLSVAYVSAFILVFMVGLLAPHSLVYSFILHLLRR